MQKSFIIISCIAQALSLAAEAENWRGQRQLLRHKKYFDGSWNGSRELGAIQPIVAMDGYSSVRSSLRLRRR